MNVGVQNKRSFGGAHVLCISTESSAVTGDEEISTSHPVKSAHLSNELRRIHSPYNFLTYLSFRVHPPNNNAFLPHDHLNLNLNLDLDLNPQRKNHILDRTPAMPSFSDLLQEMRDHIYHVVWEGTTTRYCGQSPSPKTRPTRCKLWLRPSIRIMAESTHRHCSFGRLLPQ